MIRGIALLIVVLALVHPAWGQTLESEVLKLEGDEDVPEVTVWLSLPDDHDPEKSYPVLLAVAPEAGDKAAVEAGVETYWGAEGRKRGYVVVCLQLSGEQLQGRAQAVVDGALEIAARHGGNPELAILAAYSDGGISAVVETWDKRPFRGLIGLPGRLHFSLDLQGVELGGLRVYMLVGDADEPSLLGAETLGGALMESFVDVRCTVHPGKGSLIAVDPELLFDWADRILDPHR